MMGWATPKAEESSRSKVDPSVKLLTVKVTDNEYPPETESNESVKPSMSAEPLTRRFTAYESGRWSITTVLSHWYWPVWSSGIETVWSGRRSVDGGSVNEGDTTKPREREGAAVEGLLVRTATPPFLLAAAPDPDGAAQAASRATNDTSTPRRADDHISPT
jgi:hypothetical protein